VKPERNNPLERPGRRGEGNIKIDVEVKGWGKMIGFGKSSPLQEFGIGNFELRT
jgi:hypothetical protein